MLGWKLFSFVVAFSFFFNFSVQLRAIEADRDIGLASGSVSADVWLDREIPFAVSRIFQNISPRDARPGAVVAAQTRNNPNYYYHWVRDAALTMESLVDRYNYNQRIGDHENPEQQVLIRKFMEYVDFSELIQNTRTIEGLGEPKFNVDGSAFNDPWGRPQTDGPALRALSLIHIAKILMDRGYVDQVRSRFYNPRSGSGGIVKRDLEFVSHNWRKPSIDLWEEVKGDHFYTRMVQRRALLEGADFAGTFGDTGAAGWYSQQGREIERDLPSFWDERRGYFVATKNRSGGLDSKKSELDTAIILGLLHGSLQDGFLPFSDGRVQATMNKLTEAFSRIYNINQRSYFPGVAIGRYPEDMYAGNHFNGGNPWVLCTLAMAEGYYRAATELSRIGQDGVAQQFIRNGDSFVMRVQQHAHGNGALNEQIDRNSGYMTSVEDLTWNYGAVLTAYFARIQNPLLQAR